MRIVRPALLGVLKLFLISLNMLLLLLKRLCEDLDSRPLIVLQLAAFLFHRNQMYMGVLLLAVAAAYAVELMAGIRCMYRQYDDLGREVLDKYPAARYNDIPLQEVHSGASGALKVRLYHMLITDGPLPPSVRSFPILAGPNFIFFLDDPRNMRGFGRYKVLHEIGHSTEAASFMANRLLLGPVVFCSVVIWTLCLTPLHTWWMAATIALLLVCAWVRRSWDLNPPRMRMEAEIAADSYAVQEMDPSERIAAEKTLQEMPDILEDSTLSKYNHERYMTLLKQFITLRTEERLWATGYVDTPPDISFRYALLLLAIAALPHDLSPARLWTVSLLLVGAPLVATAYFFVGVLMGRSKLEVEVSERRIASAFTGESDGAEALPQLQILRHGKKRRDIANGSTGAAGPTRRSSRKTPRTEDELLPSGGDSDHAGSPLELASRALKEQIAAEPDNDRVLIEYSLVCQRMADLYPDPRTAGARKCLREALKSVELALKKGGQNADAWNQRGYLLGRLGESIMFDDRNAARAAKYFKEAVQSHENGLLLEPKHSSGMVNQARAHYSLGKALGRQGDYINAGLHLQSALSQIKEADTLLPQSVSLSELWIETTLLMAAMKAMEFDGKIGRALSTIWLNKALVACEDLLLWDKDNRLARVSREAITAVFRSEDQGQMEVAIAALKNLR